MPRPAHAGMLSLTLAVLLVVALTGCDTVSNATDPSAEVASAVAGGLIADLDLDERQIAALEPALRNLEDRDPGALWETAAALQASLTEAQKTRLLERRTLLSERLRDGDRPRGRGGRDSSVFASLTDAQRAALREIRAAHGEEIRALVAQRRAGTIDDAAFEEQMEAIRARIRTEMETVLSAEQVARIMAPRERRRGPAAEGERAGRRGPRLDRREGAEMMPQAMIDALELTDAQIAELRSLRDAQRDALQERTRDPNEDREAVREAARERREALRADRERILTDAQRETIAIHRVLVTTGRRAERARTR